METLLALEMVRVTEAAAIELARFMGRGDRMAADRAAVQAMRRTFDDIEISGQIVIGEGERDKAPMLFIGEQVGIAMAGQPEIDIAVDPLEGTNLVAMGLANAITVLAASERGGLLNAPDTYLEISCALARWPLVMSIFVSRRARTWAASQRHSDARSAT